MRRGRGQLRGRGRERGQERSGVPVSRLRFLLLPLERRGLHSLERREVQDWLNLKKNEKRHREQKRKRKEKKAADMLSALHAQ